MAASKMPAIIPRRFSWTILYAAAWLPLSAVYAAMYLSSGASPGLAIRGTLASVLPYALLGCLAMKLPEALPWPEHRRSRFFALQGMLALAYAVAGTAGWLALLALDQFLMPGSIHRNPGGVIVAWQALIGALMYLSISGAAYARLNAARLREEMERTSRAEALHARAELALLRTQLNPHFLLNTLHTLISLVRREPELAERALESLGELLHYGLRQHREAADYVMLAEEWRFVSGYLEIESLRMGERLVLSLDADPRVMECLVPPFALQPLVENAVVHGISPRREGGHLAVTARRLGDRLYLEVCDDGPGLSRSSPQNGAGLGLKLLRERLAMLYGNAADLRLEEMDGRGLRVSLELPAQPLRPAEEAGT